MTELPRWLDSDGLVHEDPSYDLAFVYGATVDRIHYFKGFPCSYGVETEYTVTDRSVTCLMCLGKR